MTTGDWMVANSTLAVGLAWEHLSNPSGIGGVGDVFIMDGIYIEEEPLVALMEQNDEIHIEDEPDIAISLEEDDIIIEIIEYTEDVVDVI